MKITIVVGTRPEIIKMSPIIRECEKRDLDNFILHTGQHYSYNMDKVFFEQLELPEPCYNLDVGSSSHGEQTGKMLIGIEEILIKENPDVVLVEGDTNTVVAGALTATKLHIKVGHVESGLRSYDRSMPEEINRVVADHVSDFLFAPTENSKQILLNEGIDQEKIFITGNTIVDSVYQNLKLAEKKGNILDEFDLKQNEYFLVTTHRQENVDNKECFQSILQSLIQIQDIYDLPVVYPIHPRSLKMMGKYGIKIEGLRLIEPVDFLSFLQLEKNARLVLTDSGGVQEETCIMGKPCVTLRENTERPETIEVGSNILAGTDPDRIVDGISLMLKNNKEWNQPFGDGKTSEKLIDILVDYF